MADAFDLFARHTFLLSEFNFMRSSGGILKSENQFFNEKFAHTWRQIIISVDGIQRAHRPPQIFTL